MIGVKDLRIGNLVMHRNKVSVIGSLVSVESAPQWGDGRVGFHQETLTAFSQNSIEPIPLTEEWLVKLGFANEGYKDGYYGKTVKSQSLTYDFVVKIEDWGIFYELKGNLIVTIDSVHQLQNLYFALTNKELTVKEDK